MWLNGSYKDSPFASDIDLYARLPLREVPIVSALVQGIELPLLKLRVGTQVFKDMSILNDVKTVRAILKSAPKTKRWIKPVWLVWTGHTIEEVATIYDFAPQLTRQEVVALIRQDIMKYEKLYLWKALKRRVLLEPKNMRYRTILNDVDSGLMYLTRSRIDTLIKALPLFPAPIIRKALGNIRQAVQVTLGHPEIPVTLNTLGEASSALRSILNDSLRHG